jgi:hypothetical protein
LTVSSANYRNKSHPLSFLRNTASGLPALFKKRGDTLKEVDLELGEKEDLLEKKPEDEEVSNITYRHTALAVL